MSQLSPVADGTVVITAHQSQGRGQRGSTWVAEPGKNLTLSVILKPGFLPVQDQFYLNIISSLAIQKVVSGITGANVSIKWPNDIVTGGKKICGILIENQIQGRQVSNSIVGIGLNVNQSAFSIPTATSLAAIGGTELVLQEVLNEVLQAFEYYYLQLRAGKLQELKSAYLEKLFLKDVDHSFIAGEAHFRGRIRNIDAQGKLLIETDGQLHAFAMKEIAYSYQ